MYDGTLAFNEEFHNLFDFFKMMYIAKVVKVNPVVIFLGINH